MITTFNRENLVKNLPDAFLKVKGSNNDKIMQIEKDALDELRTAVKDIYESLDIDNAYGYTLDLYGDTVGQERGKATDDQYRVLIKSRIIRNLVNGDYNSIVESMSIVFGCDPKEIVIKELDEPCNVELDSLPFSTLNNLAIDVNTAVKIIKSMLPSGTTLGDIAFTGTFEFSGGTELVYDKDAGFADLTQTYGGFFGMIFSGDTTDLPV